MPKATRPAAIDVDRAVAARTNRNPCHGLLLDAIERWEKERRTGAAAILLHPLTLSTLEAEPKAREWRQGEGEKRFYGLRVVVRAYEGVPWQILSDEEAAGLS